MRISEPQWEEDIWAITRGKCGVSQADIQQESIPGTRDGQYKGPEARMCLMWLESSEEDKVTKQSGKGMKGTGYGQRDQEARAGLAVYC